MKASYLFILFIVALSSCNNNTKTTTSSSNDSAQVLAKPTGVNPPVNNNAAARSTNVICEADGKEIKMNGSLLVTKDQKKLSPGNDYMAVFTSQNSSNESMVINFVFALKPGTYPVVGKSFQRKVGENDELYGGILGGEVKLTSNKVNLTQCDNIGGHHWKIGGTVDDLVIPAMGIMLMDKTKHHPAEIKLSKISFKDLPFVDNWEEVMENAMKKIK